MEFSEMLVPLYGAFDSRIKFPRVLKTDPRPVEEFEIELYVEDQPGVGYINGRAIPLKKGTLLCAKPGQMRCSRLHFKCLYFHLNTKEEQIVKLLQSLPDVCVLPDFGPIEELFRKLLRLDAESFPEERLLLQSCLLELIYTLLQYTGAASRDGSNAHRHIMAGVERYIRDNITENLSLETLAAVANLSPSYFHKLFCAHFSMTPGDFVIQCRVSAAKSLLLDGEMSLSEVAERCGFTSQSYFTYRFKQTVGMTPLQYRKTSLSRMEV